MPAPSCRIEMLGGLRACAGSHALERFEVRKAGALLACLALPPVRRHARQLLCEHLWPDEAPEAVLPRLRQTLACLRRDLASIGWAENILQADRSEVWLSAADISTDVAEFQAAVCAADAAGDASARARTLTQALTLYAGYLLPGHYEECFAAPRARLASSYEAALLALGRAHCEAGDLDAAITAARANVAEDPLSEEAVIDLMRFCIAAGRPAEAVRAFHDLEHGLREGLGVPPSDAARAVYDGIRSQHPHAHSDPRSRRAAQPAGRPPLGSPGGALPAASDLYVMRRADERLAEAIARRDATVLVKGPRQVGKSSLLARAMAGARQQGARVALTDLQKLGAEQLESTGALFGALAETLIDDLSLDFDEPLAERPNRSWNLAFERFVRREVLGDGESHVVWALDEVDRLFECPYRSDVFALMRSWHNERSFDPTGPWSRITLVLAYSTEAHLFIDDVNRSPFNVGTRIRLGDFTRGEVLDLNARCGSPLDGDAEVGRFQALVGGHPHLARVGLQVLRDRPGSLEDLEQRADRDEGPFGDHLRRMFAALVRSPALCEAVAQVLRGKPCPSLDALYRLRSAGVLVGDDAATARPRCAVYRRYLARRLL